MLNSPFLETVICMVFVFAMLSVLASLLNEIQSQYLETRADFLSRAIQRMLSDDAGTEGVPSVWAELGSFVLRGVKLFTFPVAYPVMRKRKKTALKASAAAGMSNPADLVAAFFEHSLIKYMGSHDSKRPSYISKENFATALLEICKLKQYPTTEQDLDKVEFACELPESVKEVLLALIRESFLAPAEMTAQDTVQAARERKFRALVAKWYEDTMDRATGWYKREAVKWLFWWGLFIAVILNADTLRIFRHFMNDAGARQLVTSQALRFDAKAPADKAKYLPSPDSALPAVDTLQNRIVSLMNSEITGLDTAHLFGWHLTRKARFDSAKTKARIDSLSAVMKKDFDPQAVIAGAFDSLKTEIDFQKKVGRKLGDAAAKMRLDLGMAPPAAPAAAAAVPDSGKPAKPEKKASDPLDSILKIPLAALQAKIQAERKKLADSSQAAAAALKEFQGKIKNGREACGCIAPACVGNFFVQLWAAKWGLLITALAISFGAPFWFDLLSSLVKLRGSGAGPRLTGTRPEDKKA